ncbi:MAG: hypothetical protein WBQ09_15620 [Terriglobales bacterium]|jgi:hypothetical protein
MIKTPIVARCLSAALRRFLMAATVFLFATGASGEVNQCVKGTINSKECWVGLQVSGNSVVVTPSDVAMYSDTKLSWKRTDAPNPPDKPDFAVDFSSDDCTPFGGVFHFDQSSLAPTIDPLPPSHFESCKYKVTIGNLTVDSQVVVIGGQIHHPSSWKKRLGEW